MSEGITLSKLPGLFVSPLKRINREVSNYKLVGRRKYYTIDDAKEVWKRDLGRCYDCGIILNPRGNQKGAGHFTHRVPLKLGGKVHIDNLVVVCLTHKEDRDKKRKPPSMKITGYNALSDIVVQLVESIMSKDEERIKYFKQCFDVELKDIVDSGYYPLEKIQVLKQVPNKTISGHIQDIVEELKKEFEIIGQAKVYDVPRE